MSILTTYEVKETTSTGYGGMLQLCDRKFVVMKLKSSCFHLLGCEIGRPFRYTESDINILNAYCE